MPSGGFRPGGGRPRKNPADKKSKKSSHPQVVTKPTLVPEKLPKGSVMDDYFSVAIRECGDQVPSSDALRQEIEDYIAARGCEGLIAPQTICDYVLNRQGFLACEAMNRKIGRMTKDGKLSPYVTAAGMYNKAMRDDFNIIMHVINRYSGTAAQLEDDKNSFLSLLTNRGF